jgi:hypothetical protein
MKTALLWAWAGSLCVLSAAALPQPDARPSMPGLVSVRDFGAVGDGKTDDTAAFQRALDEAGRLGGGIVETPTGVYMLRGRLVVRQGVTLEGVLRAPATSPCGSTLLTVAGRGEENGEPFITLERNATLKGLVVSYPEQSSASPTPYPWCIRGAGDNCSVLDVLLLNPWQAVDFGTNPCGRHLIRGLNVQAIRRGIYVDRCFDIGRIEDVHIWPFWTVADPKGPWLEVTRKEGEGFIFGRSDWEYVTNSFAIGYSIGMRFIRSKDPGLGGGNYLLTQSGADISDTAVLVDETQSHSGISFSNCQIFGDLIVKPTNRGMVRFTGCGFFGSTSGRQGVAMARLAGAGRVSFENCSFHCIDPANKGKKLIVAESGRLSIVGCQFVTSDFTSVNPIPLYLGEKVVSAIIVANEFAGRMEIENHSRGQVRIADNTSETDAAYAAVVEQRGLLPLARIVPGSEVAALVPNGDFEQRAADGAPVGWKRSGDIEAGKSAAPLPKGWPGPNVVLCRPGAHNQPAATITRTLKLEPNTDYVLSAYVWSFPKGGQTVMANVDVGVDTPGEMRLAVGPGLRNVEGGYFVYGRFSTAGTGPEVTVRVFYDGGTKFADPKRVAAQWDRIAVTRADRFRPPKPRNAGRSSSR